MVSDRFDGAVVLVSGGARGMGEAHVRGLVAEGARVVIGDVLHAEGEALAAELGDKRCLFVPLDVTSEQQWRTAVARAEEAFGPLTGLVNNAGIVHTEPIETLDEADYRRVIDVDQVGVFLGMKAALPSLERAGGGAIVNISSIAGIVAFPGILGYVAAKWAVRGMTKAAAQEFAPHGIRVNSVHPGVVETPMTAAAIGSMEAVRHQPLPRAARPEEITSAVLYLLSPESSYATGTELVVDGGYVSR
ncbi:glucose 1-dehydrogenase [Streptomyces sp. NPDC050095]|uniref:glucose 1-dehydrogenase n=1 Tax=unclassified Streptomyces TaxID=2593676 RepID=UPI003433B732